MYDAAAITAAIALVDGFDNDSYVLYYPALLAFCVVYPGRLSLAYSAAIAVAYWSSASRRTPPSTRRWSPIKSGSSFA
ncbi:MAG: hypothetical protein U0531_02375 [Dehalococcoidia bacterium]